jgi:hypothetical protein
MAQMAFAEHHEMIEALPADQTRDRNRSLAIPKINRHKSSIGYQHRAILSQLPARLNLRQGQPWDGLL